MSMSPTWPYFATVAPVWLGAGAGVTEDGALDTDEDGGVTGVAVDAGADAGAVFKYPYASFPQSPVPPLEEACLAVEI